jgi:hypothetical protein
MYDGNQNRHTVVPDGDTGVFSRKVASTRGVTYSQGCSRQTVID